MTRGEAKNILITFYRRANIYISQSNITFMDDIVKVRYTKNNVDFYTEKFTKEDVLKMQKVV